MNMIQVEPKHLEEVRRYCRAVMPDCKFYVYGSRAKGTARKHSDLDLGIMENHPADLDLIYQLKNVFMCSYLPFSVDITDLSRLDPSFREIAMKQAIPLFEETIQ
jgi:uncharacterized protein